MESTEKHGAEDYQKAERVWRRIDPALDPYPEARTARETAAPSSAAPWELSEAIEQVLRSRRIYQSCAAAGRSRPAWQQLAAETGETARRLMTLYYLEKGQIYIPAGSVREELPARPLLLRQQFYRESRMASRLRQAADCAAESGVQRELAALSERHCRHAETLLRWLEETIQPLASDGGKC